MCPKTVNKNYLSFLVMAGFLSLLLGSGSPAVSAELPPAERCLDCHDDTWAEGMAQRFIHEPFQRQQCMTCHVATPFKGDKQQNIQERRHVKWIERAFTPAPTHWFKFAAPEDHGTLFVEADGNRGKRLQHKMVLPVLADLPRYDDDQTAPQITNVKVSEVKKGLFLTATISWDTDEVANSLVKFGLEEPNLSSARDNSLSTHHQVTLSGIKSKKTYKFKVFSEDLFGNGASSGVFSLATDKFFSLPVEQPLTENFPVQIIEIDAKFFQSDGMYLVKIAANQPVKLAVGSMPNSYGEEILVRDPNAPQDIKHVLTNNELRLNISICYSCHRKYQASMSHPVNVYPKRGMVIPPEYPTMEDGRMTCMSCHERHASRLENRLIKASNRELCAGCHREMK